MAPEAVAVETVFQPPSEPAQREVPQGKNTPTSRRPSWKPSALQNIHHVSIQHYHNVKRSLANLRGAGDADSKEGRTFKRLAKQYARKWTGANEGLFPPRPTFKVLFWSWVAAFLGIAVLALLTYNVPWYAPTDAILHEKIHTHLVFLIGSFGASAVLVFGSIDSPLAQPRNLVGGHVFSASVGIAVAGKPFFVCCAFSTMSTSLGPSVLSWFHKHQGHSAPRLAEPWQGLLALHIVLS